MTPLSLPVGGIVLGFAAPWLLAALAALPLIYWLLRRLPPAPATHAFAPLFLLEGLARVSAKAAAIPPLTAARRLAILALVILALSGPRVDPRAQAEAGTAQTLAVVVDTSAGAVPGWRTRLQALETLILRAADAHTQVYLFRTTRAASDRPLGLGPVDPAGARAWLAGLDPRATPADMADLSDAMARQLPETGGVRTLWLASAWQAPQTDALLARLQRRGTVTVLPAPDVPPLISEVAPVTDPQGMAALKVVLAHTPTGGATVAALDGGGRVLARAEIGTQAEDTVLLALPAALRNAVARVQVEAGGSVGGSAGGVFLLDPRAQRPLVGVLPPVRADMAPLLDGTHYVQAALADRARPVLAPAGELVAEGEVSVIIDADGRALTENQLATLRPWLAAGGVLIRFAGEDLARKPDGLLPVSVTGDLRTLGAALSWDDPQPLGDWPQASPLADLPLPADVTVRRQMLGTASRAQGAEIWARLADGTPLITARAVGAGLSVLFHVTAVPDGSDLPLSAAFPELLHRLVLMGALGRADRQDEAPLATSGLAPTVLLDAMGRLEAPPSDAARWHPEGTVPGEQVPPGLYGTGTVQRAVNLIDVVREPPTLRGDWPQGVRVLAAGEAVGWGLALAPLLAGAALVLFLLDTVLRIMDAGGRRVRLKAASVSTGVAVIAMATLLCAAPWRAPLAEPQSRTQAEALSEKAVDAALSTRLAYIITGDAGGDALAADGLAGLTQVVRDRTSAPLDAPHSVVPGRDELRVYPLIYWRVPASGPGRLSPEAGAALRAYMASGGLLVIDAPGALAGPDAGAAAAGLAGAVLADGLEPLALPALIPLAADHVLTRTFYLLDDLPGRRPGGASWVAREVSGNDGVSPVILGGRDWAGAWAVRDGKPLLPLLTGNSSRGRELARRAGVNMVMYALTGTYKADKVHLPAIRERMTQ